MSAAVRATRPAQRATWDIDHLRWLGYGAALLWFGGCRDLRDPLAVEFDVGILGFVADAELLALSRPPREASTMQRVLLVILLFPWLASIARVASTTRANRRGVRRFSGPAAAADAATLSLLARVVDQ